MLNLELSAAELESRIETVSNPRVITSNQRTARIETGTEVPYQEATSSGATSVSFKKAVLSLEVTPQITPDDRISMDINVNKDSVGEIFAGVPSIDTNAVETQVLVDYGQTVVLGGVFEQSTERTTDKVPFFGDIPVAGYLFLTTGWRRIILFLCVFPITVFKNSLRIVTLTLLASEVDQTWITNSWLHKSGGQPFFILALIILAPMLLFLRRTEKN